ncbi:ribosomal protein L21 [Thermocrinis albus DSM 14484]|uniref:Large ribosomal subunit protein bL21 n=1 Tax=Thermocrinis albus (strain DSM 14484 / JCM 11386 / HI 11/12) TaxID=638303 RepID=D3SN28_THEAH|nr:50S ribosomal protein L21 [Thermocrinis albus]ADC90158.1 ribosomal protein L21 [Thermocrinis albus DSM 14484]
MYAVIETGGKQYKVSVGQRLKVEKLPLKEGETLELVPLLVRSDDGKLLLNSGKVVAEVLTHGKHKKVIVFKFKAKKNYKRWKGHRQPYTEILIKDISLGG